MSQPTQEKKKDAPAEESTTHIAADPPAVSLEEALLACMPDNNVPAVASLANVDNRLDCDVDQAGAVFQVMVEKEEDDVVFVPRTTLVRNSTQLEYAVLACMPGAYEISGPSLATTRTTTNGANYIDPLDPWHARLEEEEERPPVSSATTVDIEREGQQQPTQTNIVSAYRVNEEEPIIATPLKDNRVRILVYGFLITAAVALIVGLSVGLTDKNEAEQTSTAVDRLVSSVLFSADEEGSFVKASRYRRTEDGEEIVTTIGDGVLNRCEVLPCNEGGCDIFNFGKVYKPGCCRGDDCDPSNKCGYLCPPRTNLCHPSFVGCRDASCFECKEGPDGEELYQYRSTSINVNCLRTGVAIGFNDEDDNVERIYKWVIGCGYIVRGGSEWLNLAPDEYVCVAVRIGDGITKTITPPSPCQLIQLGECGCAPADMHTFGLTPADKPCKTKDDCPYLCGDAGEENAKTLCDAFPGIEWWEGDNPLHQSLFINPEEYFFGNVTIQVDIHGE